jgi:hypothetical protein
MAESKLEALLRMQLLADKIGGFVREYHFVREIVGDGPGIQKRVKESGLSDWRLDFAWPEQRLAVELNGGTYSGGRHNRGGALHEEYNKLNAATLAGWRVLVFDTKHVSSGQALRDIKRALNGKYFSFSMRDIIDDDIQKLKLIDIKRAL